MNQNQRLMQLLMSDAVKYAPVFQKAAALSGARDKKEVARSLVGVIKSAKAAGMEKQAIIGLLARYVAPLALRYGGKLLSLGGQAAKSLVGRGVRTKALGRAAGKLYGAAGKVGNSGASLRHWVRTGHLTPGGLAASGATPGRLGQIARGATVGLAGMPAATYGMNMLSGYNPEQAAQQQQAAALQEALMQQLMAQGANPGVAAFGGINPVAQGYQQYMG